MTHLLDAHFSFFCRKTHKNKDGKNPIVLGVSLRGGRQDIFTGLCCQKEHWDSFNKLVSRNDKEAVKKNRNLELILRRAHQTFDSMK